MCVYDSVAERYDNTRGGEKRGDEFAAELDSRLPAGQSLVLDVGVGTGVVALGLRRRFVKAYDGAGNRSTPSNTASATAR